MNEAQIFLEWFTEKEKAVGSLVTPATAAKMIGITPQYLDKIVNAGRLTKHYSPEDNIPFIGMNEIKQEIARREEKRKLKEGKSKAELLEEEREMLQKKLIKIRQNKMKAYQEMRDEIENKEQYEQLQAEIAALQSAIEAEENTELPCVENNWIDDGKI